MGNEGENSTPGEDPDATLRDPVSAQESIYYATLSFSLDLENHLEEFAKQVPLQHPDRIDLHLPNAAIHEQRLLLGEFIKIDLSAAFRAGMPRLIEDYLDRLIEVMPPSAVPLDLVLEEQQLRREVGELVDSAEYSLRFPHLAKILTRLAAPPDDDKGTDDPQSLQAGDRLDEFTIIRGLGKGAFASVFLARQETMTRLVALKVSKFVGDEPRALAKLDHPNIVRVYDQRQLESPPVDLIYMELLPGGTLENIIKVVSQTSSGDCCGRTLLSAIDHALLSTGQIAPERSAIRGWLNEADWPNTVAWVGSQLARALHYAHRRGILHRDIKPANVLVDVDGVPKLADFNVSAGGRDDGDSADHFGGSLAYMSPEHLSAADPDDDAVRPEHLDGRADLYSLAIVLWELWQGERPWNMTRKAGNFAELIEMQRDMRKQPLPVPELQSATDRALYRVLRQALSHDREERPEHGAEFAGQLKLALHPEAAPLFFPAPGSLRANLSKLPVWLTALVIILVPNALAGVYNYFYNDLLIVQDSPQREATLIRTALVVNSIAYPLGVTLLVLLTNPIAQGLQRARERKSVSERSMNAAWRLGHRAALIGGTLWAMAGIVYPVTFTLVHPEFETAAAIHFFFSLLLCGGIAAILPFFAGTAAGVLLYYPLLAAPRMNDPLFVERSNMIRTLGGRYLLVAAGVPLLAAALAVTLEERHDHVLLATLLATAVGIVVAFYTYRWFDESFVRLAAAVSPTHASTIPMPSDAASSREAN